jgi:hypothetical protein
MEQSSSDVAPVLGVFRISIGIAMLCTLLSWMSELTLVFSNAGIFQNIFADYRRDWLRLSIFTFDSGMTTVWAAYVALLIATCFFIVGVYTRCATVVICVLFSSFLSRNYLIQYGGNALMNQLFFISIFLRLDDCFSIASYRTKNRVTNSSMLGLYVMRAQVCLVYIFAGLHKAMWPEWQHGFYVYKILSSPNFALFNLHILFDHPLLINLMTYSVLCLELWGIFLLWSTRFRRIGLIAFMSLHLGFEIFLNVHLFSLVMVAALTTFLTTRDIEEFSKLLNAAKAYVTRKVTGSVSQC